VWTPKKGITNMYFNSKYKALYRNLYRFIGFFAFFFTLSCHAASPEQLEVVQKAAEAHVNNTLTLPVGGKLTARAASLDSRLKIGECPEPLTTSSSHKSNSTSNVTVLVECPPQAWRVYVPVRINLSLPLVTAVRSMTRGELVQPQDLTLSMIELRAFRRQGFSRPEQVAGAKLKKNIRAGDVIESSDICVVCRKEKVIIKAVKNEMTITTKGTALSDGTHGEQVRVMNDKSRRIVEGVVTGIGEITVYF
jgi:flagella basal body P-ring formation protein FlgA